MTLAERSAALTILALVVLRHPGSRRSIQSPTLLEEMKLGPFLKWVLITVLGFCEETGL